MSGNAHKNPPPSVAKWYIETGLVEASPGLAENVRIDQTATHRISGSVCFFDPEDNRVELYYQTGYFVSMGVSRPIDLINQSNEEILAFSKSFEATPGPSKAPTVGVTALAQPVPRRSIRSERSEQCLTPT